ncbi:GNAT family N-acetyltransferase [Merismopedia glauca CCAP 1448/3]|uniref:GNAT family N-acetyltransferase n=2 Tax=Merismopedia TaxID=53402 RepID=A0A2T1C585_9CYAN|nr:GNAT family N-acetyltransferase [Merismopedia glauca CCAP 1448/3]
MCIRAAEIEDSITIAEILADGFHSNMGLYNWLYPVVRLGIYEDVKNRLISPTYRYICLVATNTNSLGGEYLLGTVEIAVKSPLFWEAEPHKPYVYISNLAVDRDYRRQGIAKKLLEVCEAKACQWGFREIYLHVLDNNQEARQLYLNLGYRLKQAESSWSWLWFKQPNRLLLCKSLSACSATDNSMSFS